MFALSSSNFVVFFAMLCSLAASATASLETTPLSYDPLAKPWQHLSFDKENFLCHYYDELCTNYLDGIGCKESSRTISGCNPDILNFDAKCSCNGDPIHSTVVGKRIAMQLIDNRIKPEIGWMLEPWSAGPPFSLNTSFHGICELTLHRIGCPHDQWHIYERDITGKSYRQCQCGSETNTVSSYLSTRVEELIADKINEASLMETPIFEDPVTLSVQLSIAIVMIVGKLGSMIANAMYIPPILGFLLSGMAIMDIVSPSLIKGAGGNGPHATPFGEIRIFALIIVLMRAGISLKPREILKQDKLVIALTFLPYMCEWAVGLGSVMWLFGWTVIDAGLLVSILSALSPSLVIPEMIRQTEASMGYIPKTVLTAAPVEVVISIIMFNIFSSLEMTETNPLLPWVKVLPLWANIILIPVNIAFSSIIGGLVGYLISKYVQFRKDMAHHPVYGALIKRAFPDSTAEYTFVSIVAAYTLYALCQAQYIQQTSGVLAVFAMCLSMSEFCDAQVANDIKAALLGLWVFVEVLLFTTTGVNFSYKSETGPLQSNRGINSTIVGDLTGVLILGTLGRALGNVILAVSFTSQYRTNVLDMILLGFTVWIYQLPKATVQATLGGLPYSQHIIPGADGLTKGLLIQQSAVYSILLFAPIGVFLTNFVGKPMVHYLLNKYGDQEGHESREKDPYKRVDSENAIEVAEAGNGVDDVEDNDQSNRDDHHGNTGNTGSSGSKEVEMATVTTNAK